MESQVPGTSGPEYPADPLEVLWLGQRKVCRLAQGKGRLTFPIALLWRENSKMLRVRNMVRAGGRNGQVTDYSDCPYPSSGSMS